MVRHHNFTNVLKMRVMPAHGSSSSALRVPVQNLIIAGWTGRDETAIQQHIQELEAIGVAKPRRTPMFYRVSADRLTTEPAIDVVGKDSTGEVEFVLLRRGRSLFVGLGSDHTDRKAETFGVTLSKQMCPKPIADKLWRWRDVKAHWDHLTLRCTARLKEERIVYQEGPVTAMLEPEHLLERYEAETGARFEEGAAMFCGTLAARNKIDWAESYRLELFDPVLRRTLVHEYSVRPLTVMD